MTADYVFSSTFALCIAAMLFAIPLYSYIRKTAPECAWNRHGNVSTEALNIADLLGIALFLGIYAYFLKDHLDGPPLDADGNIKENHITPLTLAAGMIAYLVPGIMVTALLMFRNINFIDFFGLNRLRITHILLIAPMGVIIAYVFFFGLNEVGFNNWLEAYFSNDIKIQQPVKIYQEADAVTIRIMIAISVIVIAPIVEEMVFRGYLYTATKRFTDRFFAAIITSLLFGVVHFNIGALLPLIFLALLLSASYELTGSLWAPISIHALFNATTIAFQEIQFHQG